VPPGRRRPAEGNVYSFEDLVVPPEDVVLDTSFVVDALIPSQNRYEECRGFLSRLADAGSVVVFNRLLEPELWEATYKIAFRQLHPKGRMADLRHESSVLRRVEPLRDEVRSSWQDALSVLVWVAVDLGEIEERVPELMSYGLSSFDAVHAATAVSAGVRAFVTLDYHFGFVPERELELYVPANRVGPCRYARTR
jgi:predicted nucleic acid-binding protein